MNPYAALGALVAAIVLAVSAFFYGEHVDNLSWEAAVNAKKAEAADTLAKATAKVAATQHQLDEINTQVEAEHAEHQAALDAARDQNQRLADQLNSLLKSAGGSGDGGAGAVSGTSGAPAGGGQLSAAYGRATELVARLLTRGNQRDADYQREAYDATECHDWAVKVIKAFPNAAASQ